MWWKGQKRLWNMTAIFSTSVFVFSFLICCFKYIFLFYYISVIYIVRKYFLSYLHHWITVVAFDCWLQQKKTSQNISSEALMKIFLGCQLYGEYMISTVSTTTKCISPVQIRRKINIKICINIKLWVHICAWM